MLNVDEFPLPNPEELFVTSGGLLDEEFRELMTINTYKELYRPTRQCCKDG